MAEGCPVTWRPACHRAHTPPPFANQLPTAWESRARLSHPPSPLAHSSAIVSLWLHQALCKGGVEEARGQCATGPGRQWSIKQPALAALALPNLAQLLRPQASSARWSSCHQHSPSPLLLYELQLDTARVKQQQANELLAGLEALLRSALPGFLCSLAHPAHVWCGLLQADRGSGTGKVVTCR